MSLLRCMGLISCGGGAAAYLRPLTFVARSSSIRPLPTTRSVLIITGSPSSWNTNAGGAVPRKAGHYSTGLPILLKAQQGIEGEELSMENIYTEWKLGDDKLLWENRDMSTVELAVLLGRGLRGIDARLSKLRDVNSPAYARLFTKQQQQQTEGEEDWDVTSAKKQKLVPISEILRRVQWDYSLVPSDFSILHYDRVDDEVIESPMDAPNDNISGSSTQLVDALPEHRIVAVKYKEQTVWDREKRLDRFFSRGGIESVIANYDEWKRNKDANEEWLRQRQDQVAARMKQILGLDRYSTFRALSKQLQSALEDPSSSTKIEAEQYVQRSLDLFNQVMNHPMESLEPSFVPTSEIEAVECLSEIVALSPNSQLRQCVLRELAFVLGQFEGKKSATKSPNSNPLNNELPEVSEDTLEETFVRGTGPGGQKINKTNNKVVLLHTPTGIRVECQDTRSLQQNRKIARKRLRLKLDEFINGSQSRTSIKAEKKASKKAKAKARSRARNRKKAAAKEAAKGKKKQ